MYKFLNDVNKIKRVVVQDLLKMRNNSAKIQNNNIVKWILERFQKKSTAKSSQETLHRGRRDVNAGIFSNQTESKNSESRGIFNKIMNFFRRKKYEPKAVKDLTKSCYDSTEEQIIMVITTIPTIQMNQSKLNYKPFPNPTWLDYLRVKEKISTKWTKASTQSLSLTEKSSSFHIENITHSLLTPSVPKTLMDEESNQTITGTFRTENPDELLAYGKKFIQQLCNTSEEIPLVKAKDFASNLSTKPGQKWWEALHENNDLSLSDSDETTVHFHQKCLWKYFQKSLKLSTMSSLTINNYEMISTSEGCKPHSRQESSTSERKEYINVSAGSSPISPSHCTFVQKKVEDLLKSHQPFHCTHFRYTSTIVPRGTSSSTLSTTPGKIAALWKYFQKSLQRKTTDSYSTTCEPRTYYTTLGGVFTYKKKPKTSQCSKKKKDAEDTLVITDNPDHLINGTFDYEKFQAFMKASASPDLAAFFTDTFPPTMPQVTIKKSMLDMIKNIFRGGRPADDRKKKTASDENLEHYKYLCERLRTKGNISQSEFEKRKLGKIHLKYSYDDC